MYFIFFSLGLFGNKEQSSLFGVKSNKPFESLFVNEASKESNNNQQITNAEADNKQNNPPKTLPNPTGLGIFGSKANAPASSNLFGGVQPSSSGGLFGNQPASSANGSNQPNPLGIFGNANANKDTNASASTGENNPNISNQVTNLFNTGQNIKPEIKESETSNVNKPATNTFTNALFGNTASNQAVSNSQNPSTPLASGGLFANFDNSNNNLFNKQEEKKPETENKIDSLDKSKQADTLKNMFGSGVPGSNPSSALFSNKAPTGVEQAKPQEPNQPQFGNNTNFFSSGNNNKETISQENKSLFGTGKIYNANPFSAQNNPQSINPSVGPKANEQAKPQISSGSNPVNTSIAGLFGQNQSKENNQQSLFGNPQLSKPDDKPVQTQNIFKAQEEKKVNIESEENKPKASFTSSNL